MRRCNTCVRDRASWGGRCFLSDANCSFYIGDDTDEGQEILARRVDCRELR